MVIQKIPRCFWHIDCPKNAHNSGVVKDYPSQGDRTPVECLHCGEKAVVMRGTEFGAIHRQPTTGVVRMSEICDACSTSYDYIYWLPNHVWELIKPLDGGHGGLLCLQCVHHRSKEAGIVLRFTGSDNWWGTP